VTARGGRAGKAGTKKSARKAAGRKPKRGAPEPARKAAARAPKKAAGTRAAGAGGRRTNRTNDSDRRVFFFGEGRADGRADMKQVLGGKGANLAEMTHLGVPVPPGFTISTAVCRQFNARGGRLSADLRADVLTALAKVE